MNYDLQFHPAALKEWRSLDSPVREQFKRKLIERLQNPHHKPSQLSCLPVKEFVSSSALYKLPQFVTFQECNNLK